MTDVDFLITQNAQRNLTGEDPLVLEVEAARERLRQYFTQRQNDSGINLLRPIGIGRRDLPQNVMEDLVLVGGLEEAQKLRDQWRSSIAPSSWVMQDTITPFLSDVKARSSAQKAASRRKTDEFSLLSELQNRQFTMSTAFQRELLERQARNAKELAQIQGQIQEKMLDKEIGAAKFNTLLSSHPAFRVASGGYF